MIERILSRYGLREKPVRTLNSAPGLRLRSDQDAEGATRILENPGGRHVRSVQYRVSFRTVTPDESWPTPPKHKKRPGPCLSFSLGRCDRHVFREDSSLDASVGDGRILEWSIACARRSISPPRAMARSQTTSVLSKCAPSGIGPTDRGHALMSALRSRGWPLRSRSPEMMGRIGHVLISMALSDDFGDRANHGIGSVGARHRMQGLTCTYQSRT